MTVGRQPGHRGGTEPAAAGQLPDLAIPHELAAEILASRRAARGLHTDRHVDRWIAKEQACATLRTRIVPLSELRGWQRLAGGDLVHHTGRFFSVLGLQVRHRAGRHEFSWDQPIIEQPEIGILGVVARRIKGILHFCLQAKEEPGNIGGVQLSPTVQATFSNYTSAHGGAEPLFLDLFISPPRGGILFSRLQTEDGSRFLFKSNRNMIVVAGEETPVKLPGHFIWLTLRQIAALLQRSNLVNACARSVFSALALTPTDQVAPSGRSPDRDGEGGIAATLQWLDDWRAHHHYLARRIGLDELREWETDAKGFFSHSEGRFFRVVGLEVHSEVREVRHWSQPIIENAGRGIIGMLLRERDGGREFLVQARAEAGNRPTVQIAPTVEFTPSNYHGSRKLLKPFLFDEFAAAGRFQAVSDTFQAEEGARFFRECHAHRILVLSAGEDLVVPPAYRWVSEANLRFLLHLGEQLNFCARSILTCLL